MSILEIYIEKFYRTSHPNDNIRVYLGINNETIATFKHNVSTHPGPPDKTTTHIFIMHTLRRQVNEYIMSTFVRGIDFGRIISAVRLPHNHHILFIYVTDHIIRFDNLIGDDFAVYHTLDMINQLIRKLDTDLPKWLNTSYNQKCIVGILTKKKLIEIIREDQTLTRDKRLEYYSDMLHYIIFTANLLSSTSDYDNALLNLLTELVSKCNARPQTDLNIDDLPLTEASINTMMNINKVCYRLAEIDRIASIIPPISSLSEALYGIVDNIK